MKNFKVIDPQGHNGLVYQEGLNVDPIPFNPSGSCAKGGIYFTDAGHIFEFYEFGTQVYEVEPVGEIYQDPEGKKWKAPAVKLKYLGGIFDLDVVEYLIEQGANIHVDDYVFRWAAAIGERFDLEVVKYLVEQGVDIHTEHDYVFRLAAAQGRLEVVKYLVEQGADIHAEHDCALQWATTNGHIDVIKYLVEHGADIHVWDDWTLLWAAKQGHLRVVKYLVEQGADITYVDYALRWAEQNRHTAVVEYLKSIE